MQINLDADTVDQIFIERLKEDINVIGKLRKKSYTKDDDEVYDAFKKILLYYGCNDFLNTL